VRRWLVLSLALGIAGFALYALLSGPLPGPSDAGSAPASSADGGAVLEEIDSASRDEMRDVLQDLDEAAGAR